MDLKEQKYVCVLADTGNLTRAAEQLYVSQPALSLYISNLEKSMGTPLFDRSAKRFRLTYAGEQYVKYARQMLALEAEFNGALKEILLENAGRIRLGVPLRRALWLLPKAIADYEKRWPSVDLILREGNLAQINEMLKNSELDLVIMNRAHLSKDIVTEVLFHEQILIGVSSENPLNEKAVPVPGSRYMAIPPEELNGQTFLLHTPFQSNRVLEEEYLKRHKIRPGRVRIVRSIELTAQMTAENLGICFMRQGYAEGIRYEKDIRYYRTDIDDIHRDVVAAYRRTDQLPAYFEDFLECLRMRGREFQKHLAL